jgi:hypothetical protein
MGAGCLPWREPSLVRNRGAGPAVSVQIYGADIARLGTSVRRVYDLPVRRPATASTR